MAKTGFWLSGATGKLAGSALQKGANGQTIIREIVTPKNPKTAKQSAQRVFMNTVIQAYSALKTITSHSFQGVQSGSQSMSRFMKLNLNYLRQRAAEVGSDINNLVNFAPIGDKGIRPARFIVSEGTLPTVPVSITPDAFTAYLALPENTYQSFIDTYDLRRGDQITLVTIEKHIIDQRNYAHFARVILDPRDSDGNALPLSTEFITIQGGINMPNERNEGNFKSLDFDTDHVDYRLSDGFVCCAGIIVSREVGSEWQRSFCQLVLSEEAISSDAVSLTEAINLSRQGRQIDINDEDAPYLDYAGVGGGQSSDSGSSSEDTPSVSNVVSITANGSTADQNVSGGSVTCDTPLTKITFRGQLLSLANIKTNTTNSAVGGTAVSSFNEQGTEAYWTGNVQAGSTLYVFKNGSLWFTVAPAEDNPIEQRP